jgi:hypothetical protein
VYAYTSPNIPPEKQLLRDPQLIVIRNQLVSTLRWKHLGSHNNRARAEKANTPTNGAKDPRLVHFPTNEEAILIIE